MSVTFTPTPLLRAALRLDAAASGAMGLGLLASAPWLQGLLGLPQPLLLGAGAICLCWGLFVGAMGWRQQLSATIVWAIIGLNALWAVESIALPALGWVQPTQAGLAFLIAQALGVAVLAELQFVGLARARRTAAASA